MLNSTHTHTRALCINKFEICLFRSPLNVNLWVGLAFIGRVYRLWLLLDADIVIVECGVACFIPIFQFNWYTKYADRCRIVNWRLELLLLSIFYTRSLTIKCRITHATALRTIEPCSMCVHVISFNFFPAIRISINYAEQNEWPFTFYTEMILLLLLLCLFLSTSISKYAFCDARNVHGAVCLCMRTANKYQIVNVHKIVKQ